MNKKNGGSNRGLVKMIILIFAGLLLLAYFGLNIREIIDSQTFQDNWILLRDFILGIWNNYLKGIISYIWGLVSN